MNRTLLLLLIFLLLSLPACKFREEKGPAGRTTEWSHYDPLQYFEQQALDSLMVDLATYIGVKPEGATSQTRFDPTFRSYYSEYSKQFRMVYLHQSDEGWFYYFLLRPARHLQGSQRGVGGKFLLSNGQIDSFEEIFNTPAREEEALVDIGKTLFMELVDKGDADQFLGNRQYIEWPDDRLKYDKTSHEWRYELK